MSVRPISYRRWDVKSKNWEVHRSKLFMVIMAGLNYFDRVDWSRLPEPLQIEVVLHVKNKGFVSSPASSKTDAHDVLHLAKSAPIEVIKASYKALARLHHPDHGGDPEQFREIQEAYEKITGR